MPEPFDPYYDWLGIPPEDGPPDHYQLLGIRQFESDANIIRAAAEQRFVYLRTFQLSPQASLAEMLLNDVAAAKLCLLDPPAKVSYDAKLKQAQSPGLSEAAGLAVLSRVRPWGRSRLLQRSRRRNREWWGLALAAVVVGLVLAILAFFLGGDPHFPADRSETVSTSSGPPRGGSINIAPVETRTNGGDGDPTPARKPPEPAEATTSAPPSAETDTFQEEASAPKGKAGKPVGARKRRSPKRRSTQARGERGENGSLTPASDPSPTYLAANARIVAGIPSLVDVRLVIDRAEMPQPTTPARVETPPVIDWQVELLSGYKALADGRRHVLQGVAAESATACPNRPIRAAFEPIPNPLL